MYCKVIIKGTSPGGEVWSTSTAVGFPDDDGPSTTPELQPITQALADFIEAWPSTNRLRKSLSTSLFISALRIEARDEDESLMAFAEVPLTPPLQGNLTLTCPLQTSVCISLRTDTPGARGRGRMFWPAVTVAPQADGRIPQSVCQEYLDAMQAWLTDVSGAFATPWFGGVSVRSVTDHLTRPVTSLRCGDVPDVQRRRRDALVETYLAVPF